ncbi:MAG: RNA polymerase sigma factor [Oscillospiraceae bacterium]|nr:RNA polymerase sigma factor [Oscillospiraceae bacterium]
MVGSFMSAISDEGQRCLVEQLYIDHEREMYSVAFRVLKNKADAEDAVHHSFEVIIDKLDRISFRDKAKSRALLLIVAKNTALNMLRSRTKTIPLSEIGEECVKVSFEELDAVDAAQIREAVGKLPEEMRHAVMLRFVYGFSTEETSELLKLSTHVIYRRVRQARELLRNYLGV